MKLTAIAFAASLVLVAVLSIFMLIGIPFFGGAIMQSPFSLFPLNGPLLVYDAIAPESVQYFFVSNPATTALHKLLLFAANVVLLTIPVGLVLKLFIRSREG